VTRYGKGFWNSIRNLYLHHHRLHHRQRGNYIYRHQYHIIRHYWIYTNQAWHWRQRQERLRIQRERNAKRRAELLRRRRTMNAFSRRYVINHHVIRQRVIKGGKRWVMSIKAQYIRYRTAYMRQRGHWLHRHRYYVYRRYWHQVWRRYQLRVRHLRNLAIQRRNAARRAANARR